MPGAVGHPPVSRLATTLPDQFVAEKNWSTPKRARRLRSSPSTPAATLARAPVSNHNFALLPVSRSADGVSALVDLLLSEVGNFSFASREAMKTLRSLPVPKPAAPQLTPEEPLAITESVEPMAVKEDTRQVQTIKIALPTAQLYSPGELSPSSPHSVASLETAARSLAPLIDNPGAFMKTGECCISDSPPSVERQTGFCKIGHPTLEIRPASPCYPNICSSPASSPLVRRNSSKLMKSSAHSSIGTQTAKERTVHAAVQASFKEQSLIKSVRVTVSTAEKQIQTDYTLGLESLTQRTTATQTVSPTDTIAIAGGEYDPIKFKAVTSPLQPRFVQRLTTWRNRATEASRSPPRKCGRDHSSALFSRIEATERQLLEAHDSMAEGSLAHACHTHNCTPMRTTSVVDLRQVRAHQTHALSTLATVSEGEHTQLGSSLEADEQAVITRLRHSRFGECLWGLRRELIGAASLFKSDYDALLLRCWEVSVAPRSQASILDDLHTLLVKGLTRGKSRLCDLIRLFNGVAKRVTARERQVAWNQRVGEVTTETGVQVDFVADDKDLQQTDSLERSNSSGLNVRDNNGNLRKIAFPVALSAETMALIRGMYVEEVEDSPDEASKTKPRRERRRSSAGSASGEPANQEAPLRRKRSGRGRAKLLSTTSSPDESTAGRGQTRKPRIAKPP
eukprot:TRINITY_DN11637_c0_g1_i1.p1 TRINITY_DN11637_c0_g1~~TRINITY_DN11637_c0_g1_i1.p1  ORF type:complete len:687 (+),score=59.17 TRINITY_DN11637_c0_g1_i1:23-2062(+)